MSYILALLAEVRAGTDHAADELADFVEYVMEQPERRVGTAFGLSRRGGLSPETAELYQSRNDTLRVFVKNQPGESLEQQIASARKKIAEFVAGAAEDRSNPDRALLQRIMATGLNVPNQRQIRKIITQ